jgi:hypothetical protein
MSNFSTIEKSGGYASPSTISSVMTASITAYGTSLVFASFNTTNITTLLLFLYSKCIAGIFFHRMELSEFIDIMPHEFT